MRQVVLCRWFQNFHRLFAFACQDWEPRQLFHSDCCPTVQNMNSFIMMLLPIGFIIRILFIPETGMDYWSSFADWNNTLDGNNPIPFKSVPGPAHDSIVTEWHNVFQTSACIQSMRFKMSCWSGVLLKTLWNLGNHSQQATCLQYSFQCQVTSIRQSTEWGMHVI